MTLAGILQNRAGRWLLGFLFWTLLGLSFASQFYISNAKAGYDVTWKQAVTFSLGDWYVFALLSIPVGALARRFRFDTGTWGRSLAVHTLGSVAFSLGYMILRAGLGSWQSGFIYAQPIKPVLV
jgi:two-component system LytT family sensor kinase